MADSSKFITKPGNPLARELLEAQQSMVTETLRNHGYFNFTQDCITFVADTTAGSSDADLTMKISAPRSSSQPQAELYSKYRIRKVTVIADAEAINAENPALAVGKDSVTYKDIDILYADSRYLRPSVIADNCFIAPGDTYAQKEVERTYRAFSRLNILKFINISFVPVGSAGDEGFLDAYIMLTPGRSQTASVELEGTNSEGDLGIAVGLSYSHRNIGKGSETFTGKVRGSYESISGNLDGLLHNRYMEYSADLGISIPEFKAPISRRIRRRVQASTEANFSMSYQERPEYLSLIHI